MQLHVDIEKAMRSGKRTFHLEVKLQARGRRIVFAGPSGAGKSLTLKAIAGLLTPDRGTIRLDGTVLFDSDLSIDLPPQRRKLAYVFQDYALFPHLSVRQNIAFGRAHGWRNPGADERNETVEYWLATFHLASVAHQFPGEISGGQRQRTALARALAAEPRALLLDEPFSALDPALRSTLRAELDALQRRLDLPLLLISHDPLDASLFGDEVFHLREGQVAGPGREIEEEEPAGAMSPGNGEALP